MASEYRSVLVALHCAVLCISTGCQKNPQPPEAETVQAALPQDFIEFYQAFHKDSIYQLSHIVFPLSGAMKDTAGRDSAIQWTAEKWTMHHAIVPDEFWTVDFTMPMDNAVVEFIHSRNSGFYMERRFAKIGDDWHLIFYAPMQSLSMTLHNPDSLIERGELQFETTEPDE